MDDKLSHGRVVAERIFRGRRRLEPFNLSEETEFPDFKLVPKDQEEAFCRWDEVQDFVHERDAEEKAKWMAMPPLMRRAVIRNRLAHKEGQMTTEEDLRLPAYKIYEHEHRLSDSVQDHSMAPFLSGHYANYKDFDMASFDKDQWKLERMNARIGYNIWKHPVEGKPGFDDYLLRKEHFAKKYGDSPI